MADFQTVRGFEDVWRPPVRSRAIMSNGVGRAPAGEHPARARLARVVARAPEVMVKVTGRTRDGNHVRAHLNYIGRNGDLPLEMADGSVLHGRQDVAELAGYWASLAEADMSRRSNTPFSHSVVLSMPAGTDELTLRDAARAFAADTFAGRHDYVFALHTDTPRPHVHLSICSRGHSGERLNPKKADLELWRQTFARALRDRGVDAEATPRRTRGVTRKPERGPLRRVRERHESGKGGPSNARRAALHDAAKAAFGGSEARLPWEVALVGRQTTIRGLYLAQARLLDQSRDPQDRALAAKVVAFVQSMPQPDTQRQALARELRAANQAIGRGRPGEGRDRVR